jgi:hypothetical protein
LHDFSKLSNFKLGHLFLPGGGGIPPSPSKYAPLTTRGESEENSEEEDITESELEGEEELQLVLYNPQNMAGNKQNPPPYEPWLLLDVFAVLGKLHHMPKHPKKFLPKFDSDKKNLVEEHVKKFLLAIRL